VTADLPDVTWVTPVPPDSAGGGGHIRQAYLLRALAARARVHLVCSRRVTDATVRAAVSSLVELDFPDPPRPLGPKWRRRLRDLWLATVALEPREVAEMAPVRRALAAELAGTRPGLVLVEYAGLARMDLPKESVKVLTLHNLGSVMASQAAAVDPLRRRRWLWRRDAARWDRWLRATVDLYDRVITVSPQDAAALPGDRVVVVPNGVDTERFRPSPLPAATKMVFTGALYTAPNVDGLRWFCSDILPLIRQRVPGATLTIAGMAPPPEVRLFDRLEGVEVVADVADLRPLLASARVAVVPLRIGSGSRLKILEAMAAGRPVVSTSIGAEGLAVEAGRHLSIAEGTDEFADAVCALLEGDGSAMAESARELVERQYAWPLVAEGFVAAVLGVVQP
jgi:glycosyltransferase involved in cell wall biosynthesis